MTCLGSHTTFFIMEQRRPFKASFSSYLKARRAAAVAASAAARATAYMRRRPRPSGYAYPVRRYSRRPGDRGFVTANDYKFVDLLGQTITMDTTGSVTLLATIAQGNTVNQREGKSAQLTSVRIRGNQRAGSTTTIADGAQYLVWDRQPNKALAAVADVLTSATSNAFPNRENAQRFVILKNFRCSFAGNTATPAAGTEIIDIDEYVKLPRECVTSYTTADTTGVIGDIISGALLWVSVGDIGAGTASATSTLSFRVNFRDQVYTA